MHNPVHPFSKEGTVDRKKYIFGIIVFPNTLGTCIFNVSPFLLWTKISHLYMCARSDSGCVRLSCRQGFPIFSSSLSLLFPKHSITNQEQYNHHQPALFLDSPLLPPLLCCFIFFWKWNYSSCETIFAIWEQTKAQILESFLYFSCSQKTFDDDVDAAHEWWLNCIIHCKPIVVVP